MADPDCRNFSLSGSLSTALFCQHPTHRLLRFVMLPRPSVMLSPTTAIAAACSCLGTTSTPLKKYLDRPAPFSPDRMPIVSLLETHQWSVKVAPTRSVSAV